MNTAVFIETYEPTMGEDKRQILMVPINDGELRVFTRITDGQKGLSNKWNEVDTVTLNDMERITNKPVGIRVTDNDRADLNDKGYSPVLAVKAVNANNRSTPYGDHEYDVTSVIGELMAHVRAQDSVVESMVIDNRMKSDTPPFIIQQNAVPTQTSAPATDDHEMVLSLASIPPLELASKYINRTIFGLKDFEVFDRCRAYNEDALIYGPTGPGKTTSVIAWAAERRLRLAQVSGNAALEPSQLIGKYIPDGTGNFVWIDGPVTDVVRNGGVLILDEVNFISPKIYTVLYSLLDSRRALILLDHKGEVIEAHRDLTIFATMNPSYIGTVPLNFAFRNRFGVQIAWDYDDKVESKLIKNEAILVLIRQLRNEAARGEIETPISTNMAMELERFMTQFNYEFAIENFIAHFDLEEQEKIRLVFQTHEANLRESFENLVPEVVEKEADVVSEAEKFLQSQSN
jgi:hypothetical protein